MKKLLALAVVLGSFISSSIYARVINGKPLSTEELKSVILLEMGCTGTFISERVFITSAHCISSSVIEVSGVKAKVITHPKYDLAQFRNRDYGNFFDMAIGILENEGVADSVEPISFCDADPATLKGRKIFLVGYGCNNISTGDGGGEKRFGHSYIKLMDKNLVTSEARGTGGLSCPGDSGAPLLLLNEEDKSLCYLSTNFYSDRKEENYSISTLEPRLKSWIQEVVGKEKIEICGLNKTCGTTLLPAVME